MKNYLIVTTMFLISLLTVSTLANADAAMADAESANLVIYRPDDGSSLKYRFWVDGVYMGALDRNESISLKLSQGEHEVMANDHKRSKLIVTVGEHGTTYIRTEIYRKVSMSLAVEALDTSLVGVVAGL